MTLEEAKKKVDTEPVGNSDTLTLNELARKLMKIFRFKYLTVQYTYFIFPEIILWDSEDKPVFLNGEWNTNYGDGSICDFLSNNITGNLDLSEYSENTGEIDYSKCIVEIK